MWIHDTNASFLSCLLLILACSFSLPGCGSPTGKWKASDFFSGTSLELVEAAAAGDVDTMDQLVSQGADVNAAGQQGMTPLFFALWARNKKGFTWLLEHGADPNVFVLEEDSVMEIASLHPDPEYLEIVLDHGGDPDLVHPRLGRTPLFFAVDSRHKENLDLLIEAGADLDHQDRARCTPMMHAALLCLFDSVNYLLEAGADYTVKGVNDLTIMDLVVGESRSAANNPERLKAVAFLEKKGVNLEPHRERARKVQETQDRIGREIRRQTGREP